MTNSTEETAEPETDSEFNLDSGPETDSEFNLDLGSEPETKLENKNDYL